MAKLEGYNKVAVIKFERSDILYHYALYDDDVFAGDTVLLDNNRVATVQMVVTPDEASNVMKKDIISEVICKVDISKYKARLEQREQKKKLRSMMDKRKKEIQKEKDDEYYASVDEEYSKLLKEYSRFGV